MAIENKVFNQRIITMACSIYSQLKYRSADSTVVNEGQGCMNTSAFCKSDNSFILNDVPVHYSNSIIRDGLLNFQMFKNGQIYII